MTTPNMGSGMLGMFRQLFSSQQSMQQRASIFARLVGRLSGSVLGGPLGIGLMTASMIMPMLAAQGGRGGQEQSVSGLDQLSQKLQETTSNLHRMNVEIRHLSDSVGQTSADTLQMGAAFAAIGRGDPTRAAAELTGQLGRQAGAFQLGQGSQQMMMGAGLLGLDVGRLSGQTPAEQMRTVIEELQKLNRTELHSAETLAKLEMFAPGRGQDFIAMAGMDQRTRRAQDDYAQAIERFMSGPRGQALEAQSQMLMALAARIAMTADLYEREREYLRSPFAVESGERREQRSLIGQEFRTGWQEGLQGTRVILETWAKEIHQIFVDMFGGGDARELARTFGEIVTGIMIGIGALVTGLSWLWDVLRFMTGGGRANLEGAMFQEGTRTGNLGRGVYNTYWSRSGDDARYISSGFQVDSGYPRATGGNGTGGVSGQSRVVLEVEGKDDFANMLQFGIRQNTNRGMETPTLQQRNAPSIAAGG